MNVAREWYRKEGTQCWKEFCTCQIRRPWCSSGSLRFSRGFEFLPRSLCVFILVFLSASWFVTHFSKCILLKETEATEGCLKFGQTADKQTQLNGFNIKGRLHPKHVGMPDEMVPKSSETSCKSHLWFAKRESAPCRYLINTLLWTLLDRVLSPVSDRQCRTVKETAEVCGCRGNFCMFNVFILLFVRCLSFEGIFGCECLTETMAACDCMIAWYDRAAYNTAIIGLHSCTRVYV